MSNTISMTPVAVIKSQFSANTRPEEMRTQLSQIVVNQQMASGLLGLEPGVDILVLFYLNKIKPEEIHLQLHPRHNPENPVTGVFATRTQFRPNCIGSTVAHIEQIEDNVITVSGLDAQNDTPVLDIKRYSEYFDADTHTQQFTVHQVSSLQEARDAIDEIDTEVVRLLGNRAKYVHQVVGFKKGPEEVPAKERYDAVMRRRRELAEEAGLNPDVIEGMYKLLVDNFIQEELELMKQRDGEK